jgi:hypothetical protein
MAQQTNDAQGLPFSSFQISFIDVVAFKILTAVITKISIFWIVENNVA